MNKRKISIFLTIWLYNSKSNVKILLEVTLLDKPVSPNKEFNIVIGFLSGLIVSISLAFLLEIIEKNKALKNMKFEVVVISNSDKDK